MLEVQMVQAVFMAVLKRLFAKDRHWGLLHPRTAW